MLSEFDYTSPDSLDGCLEILAGQNPDVASIAGGTNLMVDLRSGRSRPTKGGQSVAVDRLGLYS